jgi:uncharacterized membrane protein
VALAGVWIVQRIPRSSTAATDTSFFARPGCFPATAPLSAPTAPAASQPSRAVPAGSPQEGTYPSAAIAAPSGSTAVAADAATSPSPDPSQTTTPAASDESPQSDTGSGPGFAGAWLLVLGGLLLAGSALLGLKLSGRAFGRA